MTGGVKHPEYRPFHQVFVGRYYHVILKRVHKARITVK